MDIQEPLLALIEKADRAGAHALLLEWAEKHGYERLISDVLEPALKAIGDRWEREEFSLAQGYVAGKVAEDILKKVAVETAGTAGDLETKGPVVMGNIEDDFHALGRRMVVTFLQADGWAVHDLGNDVSPEQFVDKAVEVGAKVIGASAMMYTTATNIKGLRTAIDERGLSGQIQLAVGGAVFVLRPELVGEVGGDGTARNGVAAPALFAELWERACLEEAGR